MRTLKMTLLALCVGCFTQCFAQHTVTIKGKVQFADKDFKISVYQRGFTGKKVLAEVPLNADNTYSVTVPFDKPGAATVDCARWQSVNVWLEDEDMDIDFRGKDTAKVMIKNPTYIKIYAGKKNDLMNLVNFAEYRNYQSMIGVSQNVWQAKIDNDSIKRSLSSSLYKANNENNMAWMKYFVENYGDLTSVLVPISLLDSDKENADFVEAALNKLEASSETGKQIVADYRQKKADEKAARDRVKEGMPAPDFTFLNEKGKTIHLDKLKGKITLIDFWASWCGPCRKEIPHVKKYYSEYKDKGIQFVSVSIDAKKDAWTKALKEEQMPWLQGWTPDSGKAVLNTYQFNGIPFLILLDKKGNIYRKHLRGEKIKEAIEDCLAGKEIEVADKK